MIFVIVILIVGLVHPSHHVEGILLLNFNISSLDNRIQYLFILYFYLSLFICRRLGTSRAQETGLQIHSTSSDPGQFASGNAHPIRQFPSKQRTTTTTTATTISREDEGLRKDAEEEGEGRQNGLGFGTHTIFGFNLIHNKCIQCSSPLPIHWFIIIIHQFIHYFYLLYNTINNNNSFNS
jgi:hypothetical protein